MSDIAKKLRPIVMVEWTDSSSYDVSRWRSIDEMIHKALDMVSIGFLLHEDDKSITVAAHLVPDSEHEQACGEIMIPRIAIKSLYFIEVH